MRRDAKLKNTKCYWITSSLGPCYEILGKILVCLGNWALKNLSWSNACLNVRRLISPVSRWWLIQFVDEDEEEKRANKEKGEWDALLVCCISLLWNLSLESSSFIESSWKDLCFHTSFPSEESQRLIAFFYSASSLLAAEVKASVSHELSLVFF